MTALARCGIAASLACSPAAWNAAAIEADARGPLPASLEHKVQSLRADLSTNGYEVAQGEVHLFSIADCKYAIESIGNCLGNNPTAPYVIPTVPLWPDEFVDEHMKGLLGPVDDDQGWAHRLDPREAIVILGQLPPQGRYFGIQPYIFTRETRLNRQDPIYQTLTDSFMKSILFMASPSPSRPLVFSSLGDSINNVVIERQSGAAWGEQRFFIITSDARLGRDLSEALLRAGVPDRREIFTAAVPSSLARLGLGTASDDFMTLIRYAMPSDVAAGEQWRRELPLVVLRVRDKNPSHLAEPYAMPGRETRTARSELGLKGDVDKLVAAVKRKWGQAQARDSQFFSLLQAVDLIGDHCLQRPMNCLGDTADADYQVSETVGLDSGEILAVMGTLGTATGNATYTSLSINRLPELVGTSNLSDEDLAGTASAFSSTVGNTNKLYLKYFSRDCGDLPNCHQVTEQMVPRGESLKLIQRNYIVPGSTRGPAPDRVVNPRLIVLKR
jgi:hypothetical protein